MKKYIILVPDKTEYFFKYIRSELCEIYNLYKKPKVNFLLRLLRKFIYFIGFGLLNFFYADWTQYLDKDVQFIVFDSCKPYFRLRRKLCRAKIKPVVYYWNPIFNANDIRNLKKHFRVVSYSIYDSNKYKVGYNPQFYVDICVDKTQKIKFDGIFLGRNKCRLPLLERIYRLFNRPMFYVVKDHEEQSNIIDLKISLLSYEEYLKLLMESSSIVEILYSDNADYSLRTMEALFYQKKLITNNSLIKAAPFYCESNILIFNEHTTKEDVQNFLDLPFCNYNYNQVDFFKVDNWLKRF